MTITTLSALLAIARAGYHIYYPIVTEKSTFIIESPEGLLARVIVRKASATATSPVLTLSRLQQSQTLLSSIDYLLVHCSETQTAWLIPSDGIPKETKAIRLGAKFDDYLVKSFEQASDVRSRVIKHRVEQSMAIDTGHEAESVLDLFPEEI